MRLEKFSYGSVLKCTREDTLESIEQCFVSMKACGMDTCVIWPAAFYWEEKSEEYPFRTGKEILRLAEKCGLKIIMELAGQMTEFEYIPDWLEKKEYRPVDYNGNREWGQSSFGFLSYFHPEVKALIAEHFQKAAAAYRDFTALIGYDVFNETMFRSFDEYTMADFRAWLQEKYGSIEELNRVWERTYSDFSQVGYEWHKWMSIMPEADYNAYRKAAITRFLKGWVDAVRAVDDTHVIIADNIHSQVTLKGSYTRPQDDYDLKNAVDEIGMSFYPKQVGALTEPAERWEIFEGFYSASRREGFLISEMQTHNQALFNPDTAVKPYELRQWCLEAAASGAKGLIYWMWRPFTKGLQTLGRGIVDYKGRPTERYALAKELSGIFEKTGILKPVKAAVGIVYDPLSEDFQRVITSTYKVDQSIYLRSVYGAYRMLFDLNIPADIIRMDEIDAYDAVILTNHIALPEKDAAHLKAYVRSGGRVITDGKFAVVDEEAAALPEIPGGSFREETGIDFCDSSYENLMFTADGLEVNGYYNKDLVYLDGAETVGCFADGRPAVVSKKTGDGSVLSVLTFLFYGYAKTLDPSMAAYVKQVLMEMGIGAVSENPDIKIKNAVSEKTGRPAAVLFNYTDREQTGEVRIAGERTCVTLQPQEARVVLR